MAGSSCAACRAGNWALAIGPLRVRTLPMSLEAALCAHWAATPALNALLPVEKLTTGLVRGAGTPCAALIPKVCRAALITNAPEQWEEASFAFLVWHESYDAALAIADALRAAFHRATLQISPQARALRIMEKSRSARQHADGLWLIRIDFEALVHRTAPPPP